MEPVVEKAGNLGELKGQITSVANADGSVTITLPPFVVNVLKAVCPYVGILPSPWNVIMGLVCQILPNLKTGDKLCGCK